MPSDKSGLANAFSIPGALLAPAGIAALVLGFFIFGVSAVIVGIALLWLGETVRSRQFRNRLRNSGVEDAMRTDPELCLELYRQHRSGETLRYIAELNPDAAKWVVHGSARPRGTAQIEGWLYMIDLTPEPTQFRIWHSVSPADGCYGTDIDLSFGPDYFASHAVEELYQTIAAEQNCRPSAEHFDKERELVELKKALANLGLL